tara:strand:- start:107 stop:457 length:351 start_codon:yes stop_codon:yes gene_type:complete
MPKGSSNKIELPEFIRLSHYRIKLIKINSHICYEIGEQQGSFHSKQMIIYLDEDIIEEGGSIAVDLVKHELMHAIYYVRQLEGKNEEDTVNAMATHYTEIEKNNPDYVRWKLQNLN